MSGPGVLVYMAFLGMVYVVVSTGEFVEQKTVCCGVWAFSSEHTSLQHLLKINFAVSSFLNRDL